MQRSKNKTLLKPFLNSIIANNESVKPIEIQKVLILYDEKIIFIGDTCKRIATLELITSYFENATVDVNWQNPGFSDVYLSLLKNSPSFNNVTNKKWEEIIFFDYEVVICVTFEEATLLRHLYTKHKASRNNKLTTAFFSLSRAGLNYVGKPVSTIFPIYLDLLQFIQTNKGNQYLYVSDEERKWADEWLVANGLKENEQLYILLDSTTADEKLLSPTVFSEMLSSIIETTRAKILIFDEKNIGKERMYREMLGDTCIDRFMFATQLDLRKALCILASNYTKLIFGPCTGLLHCASGIYNHFIKNGMPVSSVPLLVVYTGRYEHNDDNAKIWWDKSPLIKCLIIKKVHGQKQLVLLSDLKEEEKDDKTNVLSCKEYTADMILHFLYINLHK
ncbi:MAG TPA: hypothetical protein VIM79_26610 [Niastella sp.]